MLTSKAYLANLSAHEKNISFRHIILYGCYLNLFIRLVHNTAAVIFIINAQFVLGKQNKKFD